jgi:hypothetical protein
MSAPLAPEHHQFDFWVGHWSVVTADGQPAGTNQIEKILGGHVLRESWVGASGLRGHCFSTWDAAKQCWHQTWVDDRGTVLLLDGQFVEKRMVLSSAPRGGHIDRITWEPLPGGRCPPTLGDHRRRRRDLEDRLRRDLRRYLSPENRMVSGSSSTFAADRICSFFFSSF